MRRRLLATEFIAACAISTAWAGDICTVYAVTDGDTIKVRCGEGEQVTIRLSGIDAPEKKQAFGQRSKEGLNTLCYQTQATITPKTKDRYGRTVADVACRGIDAGAEQVRTGMAWVYVKYAKGYETLYPLQAAAKATSQGLWADPAPEPPWDWRHRGSKTNQAPSEI